MGARLGGDSRRSVSALLLLLSPWSRWQPSQLLIKMHRFGRFISRLSNFFSRLASPRLASPRSLEVAYVTKKAIAEPEQVSAAKAIVKPLKGPCYLALLVTEQRSHYLDGSFPLPSAPTGSRSFCYGSCFRLTHTQEKRSRLSRIMLLSLQFKFIARLLLLFLIYFYCSFTSLQFAVLERESESLMRRRREPASTT